MNTKEAVAKRILELCEERNMAVNALATVSGVSPSTIYSMLNEKSKNPGVVSLKKLCDGLEISIRDLPIDIPSRYKKKGRQEQLISVLCICVFYIADHNPNLLIRTNQPGGSMRRPVCFLIIFQFLPYDEK